MIDSTPGHVASSARVTECHDDPLASFLGSEPRARPRGFWARPANHDSARVCAENLTGRPGLDVPASNVYLG